MKPRARDLIAERSFKTVEVISLYDRTNAGVRARAVEFLERLAVPYQITSYFEGNSAGLDVFLRKPVHAVRSERQLRRRNRRSPDRLLLRREASPLGRGGLESRLLADAAHGVYDIDDSLHHDRRSPIFEALFSKGETAAAAAAAANVVITGNSYLADWATEYASDVRVIPTCVDSSKYRKKVDYELRGAPRMLWLGTPSGERYLEMIGPALIRLNRETGATLTIVGDPRERLGVLEQLITRRRWTLSGARKEIAEYDVGLMPLANSNYERGKCAYKLLEYGAAGLPVVASPVGVNGQILRESGSFAPQSPHDWCEALIETFGRSVQERASSAIRLADIVDRDFSFDTWERDFADAVGIPQSGSL